MSERGPEGPAPKAKAGRIAYGLQIVVVRLRFIALLALALYGASFLALRRRRVLHDVHTGAEEAGPVGPLQQAGREGPIGEA